MGDTRALYEIWANLDVAGIHSGVSEVMDSINQSMACFGFAERLQARSDVMLGSFTAARELNRVEIDEIRKTLQAGLAESHPKADIRLRICLAATVQESVG